MVNIQAYWRMAPATWRSLTIGCVFLFTAGSLPFFHVGLISSFSLRSACSSKIGLMKKEASNIFQTPIGYFQNKLIRPWRRSVVHILKPTSSIPLFSLLRASSLLQSSASLFPVSQLSSTVEEPHRLGSERPSERKIHLQNLALLAFFSFLWEEFDRVAGEQKRMDYIIFNQSQLKDLNCHVFPPTFYQIWLSVGS